jgi:hypothetical protein
VPLLLNPFTPAEVAAGPDQFFGRDKELRALEASFPVGSVLIQGPIGIGKSSLLARALDMMSGVGSEHHCDVTTCVMHAEIATAEAAARVVLDALSEIDTGSKKVKLKFGLKIGLTAIEPVAEYDSGDIVRDYQEGRHLAALMRCLEQDYKRRQQRGRELLLIGIDEGDKTPTAVARLVRAVTTQLQQAGVRDVRFALAGVSPLQQQMLNVDAGVARAFNRVITLEPMTADETVAMLWAKFTATIDDARGRGLEVNVDPEVIDRIASLSGGHPHVAQLLGSHIIQRENEVPDGWLSIDDLVGVFQRVCYDDRGATYAATLHMLEIAGKLSSLTTLLTPGLVNEGFPTRISRQRAAKVIDSGDIQWFVEHGVLVPLSSDEYGLMDEFLRVRLAFDTNGSPERRTEMERQLIQEGELLSWHDVQAYFRAIEDDDEPRTT